MGETAYIVHSFPCDSAAPPSFLQEERINPLDALGDSISFGRFINESLACDDKWSAFPQKRYVEEAEKYSQPGAVAQKKAFFEAHYKRIAAIKAAAATLLQDQPPQISDHETLDLQTMVSTSHHNTHENPSDQCLSNVEITDPMNDISINQLHNTDKDHTEISSETPHVMEKKPVDISSSSFGQVSKAPCSPTKSTPPPPNLLEENAVTPIVKISRVESTDRIKPSQQSLRKLLTSSPIREPNEVNIPVAEVVESSKVAPGSSSDASKDYTTSMPTKANLTEMQKHPSKTTLSGTKRTKTYRTETTRSKWHCFSVVFSKSLTSCRKQLCFSMSSSLRREERASRRRQKVQQKKINDNEALEVELQTKFKQVETEVKKLRESLYSNSKKLPDVYYERASRFQNRASYKVKE